MLSFCFLINTAVIHYVLVITMKPFTLLKHAFLEIKNFLSAEQVQAFFDCPFSQLHQYHFGLGLWVRNHLLRERDPLYQWMYRCGVTETDEMSALLLQWFYLQLHDTVSHSAPYSFQNPEHPKRRG